MLIFSRGSLRGDTALPLAAIVLLCVMHVCALSIAALCAAHEGGAVAVGAMVCAHRLPLEREAVECIDAAGSLILASENNLSSAIPADAQAPDATVAAEEIVAPEDVFLAHALRQAGDVDGGLLHNARPSSLLVLRKSGAVFRALLLLLLLGRSVRLLGTGLKEKRLGLLLLLLSGAALLASFSLGALELFR